MSRRIALVTDDDALVAKANARLFRSWCPGVEIMPFHGINVRALAEGWIDGMADQEVEVCLITDWNMPGSRDGATLIRKAHEILGDRLKFILVHAATNEDPIKELSGELGRSILFIPKPPSKIEQAMLQRCLEEFFAA